ncbi:Hypothetical predicted protein [Cloeon dipterum]|uniref:Uncharacterized protein n=1 Tax=Cloeon dipterum TaxID=197152 RepID=A0A8S1E840_9INSE|nr:Hypothetical predicted protein [Cloeon dipterum]CAB3387057.1 Hypothetical predicted protein [Cloeon dipterum]CAB3388504.1 Hypothetical predicted protein [Cloeon dipterum]
MYIFGLKTDLGVAPGAVNESEIKHNFDDAEQVENFNQRFLVEAQGDQKPPLEECKKLLLLMGKPFVDIKLLSLLRLRIVNPEFMHKQAPCEAKAQCAALVE